MNIRPANPNPARRPATAEVGSAASSDPYAQPEPDADVDVPPLSDAELLATFQDLLPLAQEAEASASAAWGHAPADPASATPPAAKAQQPEPPAASSAAPSDTAAPSAAPPGAGRTQAASRLLAVLERLVPPAQPTPGGGAAEGSPPPRPWGKLPAERAGPQDAERGGPQDAPRPSARQPAGWPAPPPALAPARASAVPPPGVARGLAPRAASPQPRAANPAPRTATPAARPTAAPSAGTPGARPAASQTGLARPLPEPSRSSTTPSNPSGEP